MRPDTLPSWQRLEDEASTCTRCALHEHRTQVVLGSGDPDAELVLVGAAPGRHEDLTGEPFAGAVGNLVDNLLLDNGLSRGEVYLTTLVKCRPPEGRGPTADEIETCSPFLRAQLGQLRPRVVVALGQPVTELLLGREAPIHRLAGYRLDVGGVTVIPTHDPHNALRGSGRAMSALRRDIGTAAGIVSGRVAAAGAGPSEPRTRSGPATPVS